MPRPITASAILALAFAALVSSAWGQGGPPPEIRAHIQSLIKAWNSGNAAEWETMTQEHFTAANLKRHTPEARKQLFERVHADFGVITPGRVEGPDQPLRVHITGATGARGVIELQLEASAPFKIDEMRLRIGGPEDNNAPSAAPPPPVNGRLSSEELSHALDAYFAALTAKDIFSGNVLVAKDGNILYQKSYGFADRPNQRPNNAATRFSVGSINKTFTASAIEQLAARGKLSLTDTVGKLLPDYPQEVTRRATVDQLLHHTAGVADFFGEQFSQAANGRFRTNADYFAFVASQKPLFAPGERSQYCNGCYIVLGAIIERVSGMPYEKYIEQNIFAPAGMKTAGSIATDSLVPNVAIGYTHAPGGGPLHSNIFLHGAAGSAAGGGYASALDLLAYSEALRLGRIPNLSPKADLGIAGGAPGISAVLESNGPWTVIILSNFDPPTAEEIGSSLSRALAH